MGNDQIGHEEQPMVERHESNGRKLITTVTFLAEQVMLTPQFKGYLLQHEEQLLLLSGNHSKHKEISLILA